MKKKKDNKGKNKKKAYFLTGLIIGALVFFGSNAVTLYKETDRKSKIELIPYSEYLELLEAGDIDTVQYNSDERYMYISLHNEKTRQMTVEEREKYESPIDECKKVYYPAGEDFKKELLEKGVLVSESSEPFTKQLSNYSSLIFEVILLVVMYKMFTGIATRNNGGVAEAMAEDISVSFDDVIGHEEVKKDLKFLIKQIKSNDADFKNLTHGILFEGGAGTGKTMLAKAMAKEAGFSFISVNSSSLIQLYAGAGAKRVRETFDRARKAAPCVLFFDEIDAIGTKRGDSRSISENDQTITALLSEMDGFTDKGDILVIAATNRAADLDPALIRAGRFDRTIRIEAPTKWETRQELFDHYLKDCKKEKDVDTASLAKQTVGFSGADIAAIVREASMIMFAADRRTLCQADLEEAIDKIVFKGNRSSEEQSEALDIVAYHEAGHAVMNVLLGKPVARISIMGMTSGVGGAVFQSDEGKVFSTKKSVEEEVMILYAGRASEEIKFGENEITNGASNDITEATKLLTNYFTRFGFDRAAGLLDYSVLGKLGINADSTVIEKVSARSTEVYDKTVSYLKEHYDTVEKLAQKLLEVKTLSGDEIQVFFKELNISPVA